MKELIKLWKSFGVFDKVYTIVFTLSLISVQLITDSTLVSLVCALLGIGHVILVRKGHRYAMILGAIQALFYCIISFKAKIYGDFMLNAYNVFFLTCGFIEWKNNSKGNQVKIMKLTKAKAIEVVICTAVIYASLVIILDVWGGFNPCLDATTTTLCIVGVWLMTNRYIECWIAFNLNNLISVVLWLTLLMNGNSNAPVMMFMFGCYLVNSIYATIQWLQQIKK